MKIRQHAGMVAVLGFILMLAGCSADRTGPAQPAQGPAMQTQTQPAAAPTVAAKAPLTQPATQPASAPARAAQTQPTSGPAVATLGAASQTQPASAPASQSASQPASAPALLNVALLRLRGQLAEGEPDFDLFGDSGDLDLRECLQELAKIRGDETRAAVAIEIDDLELSWAQAQELADAIARVQEVRPVYVYLPAGDACQYLLASAGGDLTMERGGVLGIHGIAAELMFFRGTLDLLGIEPQMIQIGQYKGAAEPFTNVGPSDEVRAMYNWLLDDLYRQMVCQIARQRKLDEEDVRAAIDQGPFDAPSALKHRLVDRLLEHQQWRQYVKQEVLRGREAQEVVWVRPTDSQSKPKLDLSNPFALLKLLTSGPPTPSIRDPAIAIIHARGAIYSGYSGMTLLGESFVGARTMERCLTQARSDPRIKAVVVRIDSPGGSALASERIYQAMRHCSDEKPVIASVADMAASGGYYIAVGADTIVADPCAIIGSIGVVSGKFALTGLLEKIGITTCEFTRGANAGINLSRAWTPQEQASIERISQQIYRQFIQRVDQSRAGLIEDMDAVAQGRVFTAEQALQRGMVDQVGGLREAIAEARKAAGIEQSDFLILPRPRTLLDFLTDGDTKAPPISSRAGLGQGLSALVGISPGLQRAVGYLLGLGRLWQDEPALTAMPYYVQLRH